MSAEQIHALLVEDDDAYAQMLELELASEPSAPVTLERARSLVEARQRLSATSVRRRAARPRAARQLRDSRPSAGFSSAAGEIPIVVLTASDDDGLAVCGGTRRCAGLPGQEQHRRPAAGALASLCLRTSAAPPHPAREGGPVPRAGRPEPRGHHAARRAPRRQLQQPGGRNGDGVSARRAQRPLHRSIGARRGRADPA